MPDVHPVEKTKELAEEVDRGRSPRTPLLALTGITAVIGVIFAILVAVALILYFAYGGK
jgi:cell division protein FtsX